MKITLEDITAVELLAVAKVLNNINDEVVTPSNAPVVESDNSAVAGEIATIEEVVDEPTGDTMDFDKEGLPWDERIHSSSHKLTTQGVWARRRNITDEFYNTVKAELLAKWGAVQPAQEVETPVVAPSPYTPVVQAEVIAPAPSPAPAPIAQPAFVPVAPAPVQPVAPVAPVAPVVAPAPVQAPTTVAQASVYETLMSKLKFGLDNKLIEANYMIGLLNTVNTTFGTSYQGMFELRDREDVMQFVINELAKKGI